MTFLSITVAVDASESIEVHTHPAAGGSRTAVFVEVSAGVSLLFYDPAVLDALAGHLVRARDWLHTETTGPALLPTDCEPESAPVGETGLSLHRLPVGVA
jgi:hypothetical protein